MAQKQRHRLPKFVSGKKYIVEGQRLEVIRPLIAVSTKWLIQFRLRPLKRALPEQPFASYVSVLHIGKKGRLDPCGFRLSNGVPVENQIRTYSWCNPPRIGRQRMRPALFTVRDRGASLSKAKCVRVSL
jgi:hypothetical protein